MARRQRICTGDGDCLTQTTDCNTYGKDPDVSCVHNCQPVECPNFKVCGQVCPKWLLGCHDGRCWSCNFHFGKNLTFLEEDQECPICLETKPSVVQPNCTHSVCIDCFKRTRVDGPERRPPPPFPFPDQEDEYDNTPLCEHPLDIDPTSRAAIRSWEAAMDVWEDEWNQRHAAEENLRKCPLCRK